MKHSDESLTSISSNATHVQGTRLNLDIKRLKAEGVDSWEAFTDKYLSGHRP